MEKISGSKLPGTGTSIFAVMSGLAAREGAVNLSQGFPDFDIDPRLIDLVHHYMKAGYNQYAPMPGVPALRKAIAAKIRLLYGFLPDADDEITVTAGATQALFNTIMALVDHGDEVIVFEPAYDSYVPAIRLAGGTPVFVKLTKPDFRIDWEKVRNLMSDRTRMIILNTPNNPGGYILDETDWRNLEQLVEGTDTVILSDEVYEHIIFDGLKHESILRYPGLYARGVAVFSFGKTFHATGWKTGYTVAPPHLTDEIRKVHQFNVFSVNTPVQYALAEYLSEPAHYRNLEKFYQEKRDYFIDGLRGSRWKVIPTHGTYFIGLDYSDISDLPEFDFAVKLTRDYKVASIPFSSFYHDGHNQNLLRFCFAKKTETLDAALRILRQL